MPDIAYYELLPDHKLRRIGFGTYYQLKSQKKSAAQVARTIINKKVVSTIFMGYDAGTCGVYGLEKQSQPLVFQTRILGDATVKPIYTPDYELAKRVHSAFVKAMSR